MLNKCFKLLVIFIVLVITNTYGNDYSILEFAFNKQQESFGLFFQFFGGVLYFFELDYVFLHSLYLFVIALSVTTFCRNLIFTVTFILLVGLVLNEQARFFSAFLGALALFRLNRPMFAVIFCAFIHVGASVIFLAFYGVRWAMSKVDGSSFFLLFALSAWSLGLLIKQWLIAVGGYLGYGYTGTVHLEPLSIQGVGVYVLLVLVEASLLIVGEKSFLKTDRRNYRAILILGLFSSGIAIVSGRLLFVVSLYYAASAAALSFSSRRKVGPRHNKSLAISFGGVLAIPITWILRSLL